MMGVLLWHLALMLGLGSLVAGQTCVSDQDCPLSTSCQITTGQCVAAESQSCTTNTDCNVLQTCNPTADECVQVSCQSDADCSGQNTWCADTKYCDCSQGFSLRNGQCTNDLGRVCAQNSDCGTSGVCNSGDSVCECNGQRGFLNDNGVCKHVIGTHCTADWNCTKTSMSNVGCQDGVCDCHEGYVLKNNYCQSILHTSCTSNSDCPMDNAECRNSCTGCTSLRCRCVAGTSSSYTNNEGRFCKKVIGHSCNEVNCNQNSYFNMPVYCDADYICSCPEGYTQDGDTSRCIPVYGKPCDDDSDCGSSSMYQCDSGNCICADSALKASTQHSYGYSDTVSSVPGYKCSSVIGQNCEHNLCEAANGVCNGNNNCECKIGTFANDDGICIAVLDLPCKHDVWCKYIDHTRCGTSGQCECQAGYRRNGLECVRVLGSACSTADDCLLEHSICGGDGVCECEGGYPQFEDRCLISACHVAAPVLPDLHRRFQTYTVRSSNMYEAYENIIRDSTLDEKWYSVGLHTLASSDNTPPIERCGTYYPIYLKSPLTEQQKLTMESSEIVVTAMVGGIDTELGQTEDIEMKLRKCGDETLVYLKAPRSRFSAYCLTSNVIDGDTRHIQLQSHPYINSNLGFYEDTIDGTLMDVPYNYYECIYSVSGNSGNLQGMKSVVYAVHWYVNYNHIATYGPLFHPFGDSARLTDMIILEHGYKLGFTIQCSVERASTFTGKVFYPTHSWEKITGDNDYATLIPSTTNSTTFHNPSIRIPLGCMAAVGDESLKCTLKFDVVDSSGNTVCPLTDTDRHPACGVSIVGLTKHGQTIGHYSNGGYVRYKNSTTNRYHYEYYGSLIQIYKNLSDSSTLVVKLQHSGETTGHRIWDEYEYPDIKIKSASQQQTPYGHHCSVGRLWIGPSNGKEMVHKYEYFEGWWVGMHPGIMFGNTIGNIEFGSDKEYILMRSRTHPVEVQIKTKVCDDNTGFSCVCAVTFRNGNNIETVDHCNTAPKVGSLYGSGATRTNMGSYQLLNDFLVYVYYWDQRMTVSLYGSLDNTDGLCSFEADKYHWRDGNTAKSNAGFATSWKISADESLLNPANHISYGWNESFYMCHCPKSTDEVPNRLIQSETRTRYYTGHLKCTTDNECTTTHTGEVWRSSLLPPYAIDTATVTVDLVFNGEFPVLQLKCNFHAVNGYLYIIDWTMNGISVLTSDHLQASETETFFLTDDYAIEHTTVEFFLDIPIVCGVSVHSSNREKLTNMMYSDPFYPIEILNTEVNILRGGDAVLTLKQNMPFGCSPGPDCRLLIKLIDPDDTYKCKDSTVAVKDRAMCGKEIKGAMSSQQVSVAGDRISIVITTKNNNKYSLRTVFTLKLQMRVHGNGKTIYEGEFGQRITVFVRERGSWHYRVCYANNDPRMGTFDRIYFGMQLVGIFIMYRHKTLQVEVQMMTQSCNGGWASCSCGVAVAAGRDVYVINHCYGHHITGYLLNDDKILTVRRRSTTRYQIYMPHGTMVDVFVSPWRWYMVNINIYPSPTDFGHVYGLCGDFNGVRTDDMTHRDGTVTPVYGYYWYYNPDAFSSSWRIDDSAGGSESLFNITGIRDSLQSWSADEQMCVCPDDGARVLCSANEEDTCVEPVNKRGVKLETKTRVERSTRAELNYHYETRLNNIHKRSASARVVKRSTTQSTNISVENATEMCREAMEAGCTLFKMKNDTPSGDPEEIVRNCGRDLAINPDIDWSGESCARYQAVVDTELERDVEFKENNTEAVEQITAQNCINNCNNHGTCKNEKCECSDGFVGEDCLIDIAKAPEISFTPEACNPSTDTNCDCTLIVTDGHDENATCKLSIYEAGTDGTFTKVNEEETPAQYENYNEMFCCQPTSTRRKRSVADENADDTSRDKRSTGSSSVVLGTRVYIIVSNNGVNFSSGVFIDVLDPTCQEYVTTTNGDMIALLKTGYCFINGDCFVETAVNPTASCEKCDTSKATYAWTEDGCTGASQQSEASSDDGLNVVDIVMITIGVVVALTLAAVLVVFLYYKSKRAGVQPNPSEPQPLNDYTYDFKTVDNNKKPVFAWKPGHM